MHWYICNAQLFFLNEMEVFLYKPIQILKIVFK